MPLTITAQIRSERQARATQRQAEYNKLSLQEKLARLPEPGAKKQRARLLGLIQAEKDKAAKKAAEAADKTAKKNQ